MIKIKLSGNGKVLFDMVPVERLDVVRAYAKSEGLELEVIGIFVL